MPDTRGIYEKKLIIFMNFAKAFKSVMKNSKSPISEISQFKILSRLEIRELAQSGFAQPAGQLRQADHLAQLAAG